MTNQAPPDKALPSLRPDAEENGGRSWCTREETPRRAHIRYGLPATGYGAPDAEATQTACPGNLGRCAPKKVELCGQRALKWLREGRSPVEPHDLIAPFGTQPRRAWNIRPHNADETIEISESDEDTATKAERDAAEQRGVAFTLIGQLLAHIDSATRGIGNDAEPDHGESDIDADGPIWPGPDDRTRTLVAARAQ